MGIALAGLYAFGKSELTATPEEAEQNGEALLTARNVLAIGAHPDDLDWYAAGTLRRLSDSGARVTMVIVTDGEKGPNRIGSQNLAKTRRAEQEEAARVVGAQRLEFLNMPDRGVQRYHRRVLEKIVAVWRDVKPDAVLTFDPVWPRPPYFHLDHEGTGKIVRRYWLSLPQPRPRLFLFHTRRPNTAVDVTEVAEIKQQALAAHRSQVGDRIGRRNRGFMRADGRPFGDKLMEVYREERR